MSEARERGREEEREGEREGQREREISNLFLVVSENACRLNPLQGGDITTWLLAPIGCTNPRALGLPPRYFRPRFALLGTLVQRSIAGFSMSAFHDHCTAFTRSCALLNILSHMSCFVGYGHKQRTVEIGKTLSSMSGFEVRNQRPKYWANWDGRERER